MIYEKMTRPILIDRRMAELLLGGFFQLTIAEKIGEYF
jgi:hypothetical protein